MFKIVTLQMAATLIVALAAGSWIGERGAVSALIGGLSYLLPNLLFVLRLSVSAAAGRASPATFFVGELGKLLATIAILAAAHRFYDVHWLTMLIALFATLKANLFGFLLKV
jgi:ATP synthase protein I